MKERPVPSIVKPVTSDGLCGYDQHEQFMVYWYDPPGSDRLTGTMLADLRGEKCLLCDKTWEASSAQLRDQYWVDSVHASVHKSCYVRHLSFLERKKWYGLMCELVDTQLYRMNMEALPNGYGGGWDTPWFRFSFQRILQKGEEPARGDRIVQTTSMGARRRVDSIQFEKLTVDQAAQLEKAFEDVGDTKGISHERRDEYSIHAWNDEQCKRYLKTFLMMVGVARVPKEETKSVTA